MTTTTRCSVTELLVDQCAHCLGHTLDAPVLCRLGYPFDARYPGQCQICLDPIEPGDRITLIRKHGGARVDGYAHATCTPGGGTATPKES